MHCLGSSYNNFIIIIMLLDKSAACKADAASLDSRIIVGHVPKKFFRFSGTFLQNDGEITCEITQQKAVASS